jgi:phenylacetate-CoA ligase
MGRSDDMIIFRAVNIYPGQIDHVLSGIDGVSSEFQIIITRGGDGKDYMTLRVERRQGFGSSQDEELRKKITEEIKKQILVTVDVELVEFGTLPRSERKTKRVFDHRDQ